jgi:hypothetical protein
VWHKGKNLHIVIKYHQLFVSKTANDISHPLENALTNIPKLECIIVDIATQFIYGTFEKNAKK